jgi:putative redox protein
VQNDTVTIDETKAGAFQVKATAGTATFFVDEPLEAGGLGSGPTPYDLLSAAIGSCSLMTMRLYADRKKWPLERIRVSVTHHRDGLGARDVFVREIQFVGTLDDAQRARLVQISKRCPVHLTIERGSEIQTVLLPDEPLDAIAERCAHLRDMNEACEDESETASKR